MSTGRGSSLRGRNFAYLQASRVGTVAMRSVPTTSCGARSNIGVTTSTIRLWLRRLSTRSSWLTASLVHPDDDMSELQVLIE